MCNATKGLENLDMAFCDGADEASFWGTLYQDHPYKWTPAYSLLEGFDMSMVFPDLLHVWHLGVARDLIGGAMRTYMDFAVWGAGNEQTMLEAATSSLKHFLSLEPAASETQQTYEKKTDFVEDEISRAQIIRL